MNKQAVKKVEPTATSVERRSGLESPQGRQVVTLTPEQRILALQGKAGNQAVQRLLGDGQPLADGVRKDMESRFGTDLSDVRIHDNSRAHISARQLGAKAYTYGKDIVFDANCFAPYESEGRRLLAHELAHVVQQRGAKVASTQSFVVPPIGTASEIEAGRVESQHGDDILGAPEIVSLTSISQQTLQRAPDPSMQHAQWPKVENSVAFIIHKLDKTFISNEDEQQVISNSRSLSISLNYKNFLSKIERCLIKNIFINQ